MPGEISQADVMTALLQAVLNYGQGKAAEKLDVAVSTLSNKLQPYNNPERRHFLNLWEADDIGTFTGDARWLELLAARHGFLLLPMDAVPDALTLDAEKLQDVQTLAHYQAEEDPVKAVHALNTLLRELLETQAMRKQGKVTE